MDQYTNLSLCAGGGGLDLGLELVLGNLRTVCWVEWEAFAISYLVEAMEAGCLAQAPVWTDLRTFDGRPWRGIVDCLTAGYPCQPFSVAGKRRGEDDPRHLWPHVARVIGEVEPSIVFLENVPGHLSLGFEKVAGDLQAMGYEVTAGLYSAAEIGASHKRERLFIVAQSDKPATWSGRRQTDHEGRQTGDDRGSTSLSQRPSSDGGAAAANGHLPQNSLGDAEGGGAAPVQQPGQPCGVESSSAAVADAECSERRPNGSRTADAVGEECRREEDSEAPNSDGGALADAANDHRWGGIGETEEGIRPEEFGRRRSASCNANLGDVQKLGLRAGTSDGDVQQESLSFERSDLPLFPPRPGEIESWRKVLEIDPSLEPAICGMVDGMASHRLRLLGNGVVPLQAAYAFCSLWSSLQHKGTE